MQRKLNQWSKYLSGAIFLIASLQLLGILFNIDFLKNPLANFTPMNSVSATALLLLTTAFLLHLFGNNSRTINIAGNLLAKFVLLIALMRFTSFVFKFRVNAETLLNLTPMSPGAIFCFLLAAINLQLIRSKSTRNIAISQIIATTIFLFSIFNIFLSSYHSQSLKGIFTSPMAFSAAICFLLYSIAILLANPDKGFMRELTTPYAGSLMGRRLIPAAIILPFLYGFMHLYGYLAGFYDAGFGIAVAVLAVSVTCIVFIFYNARLLNKRDVLNEHSKFKLNILNSELEKKIAEKMASERLFSSLFYKSPVMKAIAESPSGKYVEVNDAFADFWQLEKKEILGKTSLELNMFVNPEQRDEILKKLQKDGYVRAVETQVFSKKGTMWVSTNIDKMTLDGKDCFLTAAIDITERKLVEEQHFKLSKELEQKVAERTEELTKSEQKFRKLLENNFEIITLTDENFIPFYRSPSAQRIMGWTLEERRKEQDGYVLTHPDDVEKTRNAMKEALSSSGKIVPVSFRSKHKEGHYIWVEGFFSNMLDDESIKGIVGNFRDITKRKEAEAEIQKLTGELRGLLDHVQTSREEERKYIAREIHDELGSALTALKIDVSMMMRKMKQSMSEMKDLSDLQRCADFANNELTSVLNQLDKSIQSVKSISSDLRPEILDHLGVIDAVKWKAQQFENMTGIKCTVSTLPDILDLQPAVSATVYRTVQEGLTNVAKHANASVVKILIEQDVNSLLVEIKDNGKGITEIEKKSGKSLGLIGMRERVKILNGTLNIAGEESKGTVLTIKIPLTETILKFENVSI